MPTINNLNTLALDKYGITIENETRKYAIIKLFGEQSSVRISRALYDKLIEAVARQTQKIKLPKIYFGVELEFVGSSDIADISNFDKEVVDIVGNKNYNLTFRYTHNTGYTWILGRDSSIDIKNTNIEKPYGYELSSPKLELFNEDNLLQLNKILLAIKDKLLGITNESCGTHIHIGFSNDGLFPEDIKEAMTRYSKLESMVFDPIVPKNRRRNKYCKATIPKIDRKYQKLSSRYCKFPTDKCYNTHFEFRQLEGTLDYDTIIYWAILQATIIYDIINNLNNENTFINTNNINIFDVLFTYDFDKRLINHFIKRVVEFKAKTIQTPNIHGV